MKTLALISTLALCHACFDKKPNVIHKKPLDMSALSEDYQVLFGALSRARVRYEYLITIQDSFNRFNDDANKAMKEAIKAGSKKLDRGTLGDDWLDQAEDALEDPQIRYKYLLEHQANYDRQYNTIKNWMNKEIERAKNKQAFGKVPSEVESIVVKGAWDSVFEKAKNRYKVDKDDYVTKFEKKVFEDSLPEGFKEDFQRKGKK